MVGANAVDLQHFRAAHDRELLSPPSVDFPDPFAHRTTAKFSIAGQSMTDHLTRHFAGDEVIMEMTDWGGTLMFVRATFRHTQSYGMLAQLPLGPHRTFAHVTVFVPRHTNRRFGVLIDPINALLRRLFIRRFLHSDVARLAGTWYNPETLIEIDRLMLEYFEWLSSLPNMAKNSEISDAPAVSFEANLPEENDGERIIEPHARRKG
jgi:hypothetical protein